MLINNYSSFFGCCCCCCCCCCIQKLMWPVNHKQDNISSDKSRDSFVDKSLHSWLSKFPNLSYYAFKGTFDACDLTQKQNIIINKHNAIDGQVVNYSTTSRSLTCVNHKACVSSDRFSYLCYSDIIGNSQTKHCGCSLYYMTELARVTTTIGQ